MSVIARRQWSMDTMFRVGSAVRRAREDAALEAQAERKSWNRAVDQRKADKAARKAAEAAARELP